MKIWKRLLALCLASVLLLCALPAAAASDTALTYERRDDGLWITGAEDASGALVLPEEIDGQPVVGVAARAFENNTAITTVKLPQSLRFIEEAAFSGCHGIREPVNIPDGVEWVWPDAFSGAAISGKKYSAAERCALLSRDQRFIQTGSKPGYRLIRENGLVCWIHGKEAELLYFEPTIYNILCLPETVQGYPLTSIGPFAGFPHKRGLADLHYVVIPGTVKTVGAYAFYDMIIASIFLHEGVQELKDYALCTSIHSTGITLPASLQTMGESVFAKDHAGIMNETVYAYSGTPASEKAKAENCHVVSRIGANGIGYGFYAGLSYTEQDGEITITKADNISIRDIPAEIDGAVVTEIHFKGFSSSIFDAPITIPPTVTKMIDEDMHIRDITFLVYPGSYAEEFCRKNGCNYESVYTAMGVPFTDTPKNLWHYEPVCYVYNTGLMSGVSDTRFAPEETTTRAMLVTVLWRLAGSPKAETEASFSDIVPGSWYAAAVDWAQAQGIVQGVSEDRFAPNDPVSREQIATILLRYAQKTSLDDGRRANVSGFPDAAQISPWAMEGIRWAKAQGILNGQLSGNEVYLNPRAGAKRSEIAAILMRFTI